MKWLEAVLQDHGLLRRGLDIIDGMLKHLEDGLRIEIADVAAVLKFLRLFGDQYHQVMEDEILFPALLDAAPDEIAFRQFVAEHGSERTLVVEIEATLTSRKGMAFFRSARHLTALLRHHCDKEERILCELAGCLSEDEDQTIVAEFMKARPQSEIHAKFPRLKQKYLPKPLPAQLNPATGPDRARSASSHG